MFRAPIERAAEQLAFGTTAGGYVPAAATALPDAASESGSFRNACA
jgi:hypothetical protein